MEKLRIFRFSKQELLLSLPTLAMLLLAQAFMLCYHFERFTRGGNLGFWSIFAPKFTISGFDPYIYLTLSSSAVGLLLVSLCSTESLADGADRGQLRYLYRGCRSHGAGLLCFSLPFQNIKKCGACGDD